MNLQEAALEIREIIKNRQQELGLTFTEDTHTYFMRDENGEIRSDYPSVSKVLKSFYEEFPVEEASFRKSKGDPQKQQELIEEWAESGNYAANLGSRVHYLLEKSLIEDNGNYKEVRQPIFECDIIQTMKSDSMVKAGMKYLKLMKDRGAVLLDTEIVLGDNEMGYTGQPDKVWLMINKDKTEIGLVITDWKSNKKKNFEETRYTKKMYEPFQSQPSTSLGHYYIQLPLYGKLLLKMLKGSKYENIKLLGCVIVHLTDDADYSEYKVPVEVINTVMGMNVKDYLDN